MYLKSFITVIIAVILYCIPVQAADTDICFIDMGWQHSAVITEDGSLWMWGRNNRGQLGNNSTQDQLKPARIMKNVVKVETGGFHSAAIKEDGSLWMWGYNEFGQLGNGSQANQYIPKKLLENVQDVSLGFHHSAAILEDGSLWMWGRNHYGQLGDGTDKDRKVPVKILENVTKVSLGADHSAALLEDGSLYLWGYNNYGEIGNGNAGYDYSQYTPVKIMDDVKDISLGSCFTVALKEDGSLWAWGSNSDGKIGSGYKGPQVITPVKIMDDIIEIETGDYNTLVHTKDNQTYIWGNNQYGQVNPDSNERAYYEPQLMEWQNIAQASIGGYHIALLDKDGDFHIWGHNRYGQIGNGTTTDVRWPYELIIEKQEIHADNISTTVSSDYKEIALNASCKGNVKLIYESDSDYINVDEDGIISIEAGYIGEAVITITAPETHEYCSAQKEIVVKVRPQKASITSLSQTKDGIVLCHKKNTGNVKYQIHYSTSKDFNKYSNLSNQKYEKAGIKIKDFKIGKKYYFKIRGYKEVNDDIYYGKWSDIFVISTEKFKHAITAENIIKTVSSSKRTYSINVKCTDKAKLSYKSNNSRITVSKKGVITIPKNYIGKATITITAAETDNYLKTSKKITITIKPVKATITELKNKSKKILIKFKKNTGSVSYEIQCSRSKSFSSSVKKVTVSYNKSGYYIKNLTKGKNYYFRIRGVKRVSGKTYYGSWSDVKKVKVK